MRAGAAGLAAGAPATALPRKAAAIERLSGVWVQGMGYDVQYGAGYDVCAQRCMTAAKCVMIEYYRPEKKCNLYDVMRPRLQGGSSDVGIKG